MMQRQVLALVSLFLVICDASMVVEVAYGKKECFRLRVPDDSPSIIRYDANLARAAALARESDSSHPFYFLSS